MNVAESESHEGKRKTESLWPIMRITHTRTRYIYDLYYKREAISKELYDWLCKQEYADAKWVELWSCGSVVVWVKWKRVLTLTKLYLPLIHSLIAKWKKSGYEKLCCARCIQTRVSPTSNVVWSSLRSFGSSHVTLPRTRTWTTLDQLVSVECRKHIWRTAW